MKTIGLQPSGSGAQVIANYTIGFCNSEHVCLYPKGESLDSRLQRSISAPEFRKTALPERRLAAGDATFPFEQQAFSILPISPFSPFSASGPSR
jgi:hypothetical protein